MIHVPRSRRWAPAAKRRGALGRACACASWLSLGLVARAHSADDPNPYFIGVSQAITHDSNVYRVPANVEADTYLSTGFQGGVDQPFGSQRFYLSGNAKKNRFERLSVLDNTSYGLDTGLEWATISALSGTLRLTQNQSLATYGTTNQLAVAAKNLQKVRQMRADVRWGRPDALLGVESGYLRESLRYSAPEYAPYETDQTVVHVGLAVQPSSRSTLGVALRRTSTDESALRLPDGSKPGYDRDDVDVTIAWLATGASTLNGRLSFGRQTDRSGAGAQGAAARTGLLQWLYAPIGKLSFDASVVRDTGQNTTFQSLSANGATATLSGDNSQVTTTVALSTSYAWSAKIGVTLGVRQSRRSLAQTLVLDNVAAVQPAVGSDRIRLISLGMTYVPTTSVALACSIGRDERSVSDGTPNFLSYPYAAKTAACSAQFNLH